MKTIDNYISERLNPKKLGPSRSKFPIDGSLQEVVNFLKEWGFTEIQGEEGYKLSDVIDAFNKSNSKVFYVSRNGNGVRFADTSEHKISNTNQTYYISGYLKGDLFYLRESSRRDLWDKPAFLNAINNQFKWS